MSYLNSSCDYKTYIFPKVYINLISSSKINIITKTSKNKNASQDSNFFLQKKRLQDMEIFDSLTRLLKKKGKKFESLTKDSVM